MQYLTDPTVITIGLLIALIMIIVWGRRSGVSPGLRDNAPLLEEALRRRGMLPLIQPIRSIRDGRDDKAMEDLQAQIIPLTQDQEFATAWLMPMLRANMGLIVADQTLLIQMDMVLRTQYGYRLKPIHHTTYGLRPEAVLHATAEENDMCMRESQATSLSVGRKTYVGVNTEATTREEPVQTQDN